MKAEIKKSPGIRLNKNPKTATINTSGALILDSVIVYNAHMFNNT